MAFVEFRIPFLYKTSDVSLKDRELRKGAVALAAVEDSAAILINLHGSNQGVTQ
jgi:hypothetical protein